MYSVNLKKKIIFTIIIILLSIIILIHKSCNLKNILTTASDYNFKFTYYSCKIYAKNNFKNYLKDKISNTIFEKFIRDINKNQIKNKYSFLKEEN